MVNLKHFILVALAATSILMAPGSPALLQAAEKATDTPPERIHITSDAMMFDEVKSQVEFTGNVVAIRPDATIHADHVTVILFSEVEKKKRAANGTTAPSSDNIKQLIASGNVRLIQNDGTATADKAVYSTTEKTIVLTGNSPTVLSGNSRVTGKKITLFQDTRRVVVESEGAKRVEAFFDSSDVGSTKTGQTKN